MNVNLKPLNQQVLVITGASSGIGLATARMAARRGARLVLASRSGDALRQLEEEIHQHGGQAMCVEADVGHEGDVERIAAAAEERFGGFDTWVNNAGSSIYGKLEDVPVGDFRKLFETNFWGVVYGSLSALRHLRVHGGAIINLGSVASDSAIPLQGMYSATKHAVKGFTDALRMEVEADRLPVSVTLIKPSAIDTPYSQHAKNYLADEPTNPSPLYAPEVVAQTILRCAEQPCGEVIVGGIGKLMSLAGKYTPRLRDWIFESALIPAQHSGITVQKDRHSSLEHPTNELRERGEKGQTTFRSSIYTQASFHPVMSGLLLLGGTVALTALMRGSSNGRRASLVPRRSGGFFSPEQRM